MATLIFMKWSFFLDIWNVIDTLKTVFVAVYLIFKLGDLDISDDDLRLLLAIAVFLNWIRIIGFFRIFKHTRYLIRMIIEIVKGIIPFLTIVFIFTLALSFCLMALRDVDFLETWDIAYKLVYGEFEDQIDSHRERILFLIATLSMTLLMLNLLIAIMSDRYDFI